MNKTHWRKYTNPNYLGSYAFQPGETKTLTIKEVKREIVTSERGKEECTVVHFAEGEKPLILNKTNADAISKAWGTPYIEDWSGKRISLKVKKVSAFGEMVDAVRVSKERPVEAEQYIICESCGKPVTAGSGRTAKEIAAATKNKYKKVLCIECVKKEKEHGRTAES